VQTCSKRKCIGGLRSEIFINCNSPDSQLDIDEAVEILEVRGEEIKMLKLFKDKASSPSQVNLFVMCTGLILLSDSTLTQKSELLILLFDTNENYIIGENELHVLARCCLQTIAILAGSDSDIKMENLVPELDAVKAQSKYVREEGISVNDFTNFLLNSPSILSHLNRFGLFL
jgi:hypothetical protein